MINQEGLAKSFLSCCIPPRRLVCPDSITPQVLTSLWITVTYLEWTGKEASEDVDVEPLACMYIRNCLLADIVEICKVVSKICLLTGSKCEVVSRKNIVAGLVATSRFLVLHT